MKTNSKKILFALCSLLALAIVAAGIVFNYSDLLEISPLAGISLATVPAIFIPKTSLEAKEYVGIYLDKANELNNKAKTESRNLTNAETVEFQTYMDYSKEMRNTARTLEIEEMRLAKEAGEHFDRQNGISQTRQKWVDREGRSVNVFGKGENYSSLILPEERNLSIGRAITAMIRNDWSHAEGEKRALANSIGSGSILVPIGLYGSIVDKARSKSTVFQAGAQLVDMTTKKMSIARVLTDPTFVVKAENAAFPDDDMTFDGIELDSFTIGTVIYASREVIADSPNAAAAIENALMGAFAAKFDQLALIGAGTTEPTGILNTTGVQTVDFTEFSEMSYANLVRLWYKVMAQNGDVSAFILNPRELAAMGLERTDIGYGNLIPDLIKTIPILHTTGCPINLGVSEDQGVCFAGDFTSMLVGLRQGLEIEVSTNAGDTFKKHQVAIKCTWRGDIALTRPTHFVKGINIANPFVEA
ncbi:MAG: phage major capsid protein [Lentimicrobium sp.]|nr:phage major capsid protein [Lentimicrobium sp.]